MAAILNMAQVIANADGKVTNQETLMMAIELARFGVSPEKSEFIITLSNNLEASDAVSIISRMTPEEKRYVASYLGALICSDGEIDDNEVRLWSAISQICNLPRISIREALDYMSNL